MKDNVIPFPNKQFFDPYDLETEEGLTALAMALIREAVEAGAFPKEVLPKEVQEKL